MAIAPPTATCATPTLYSSSNDGTIKSWCALTGDFKKDLINYENEVEVMYVHKGVLYAGDDKGSVSIVCVKNCYEEAKNIFFLCGIIKSEIKYAHLWLMK
jgi:hypothetical protein